MNKLAANIELYSDPDGFSGFGAYGLDGTLKASSAGTLFNKFITTSIGLISIIAFVWFVFIIITGALSIMTSGGDKQALEGARKKIFNGIIGLVVLVAGVFLVSLIGQFLGIESILNPGELIRQISQ